MPAVTRVSSTIRARLVARTGPGLILIGIGCLVAYIVAVGVFGKSSGRIVFGDATHHFVQLRSMVFDHDLDFRNEYVRIYGLHGDEAGTEWVFTDLTPTGHVRNYMPVGPALLWAPLYLLVAAVQTVLSWIGLAARPDGFDRALQLVPGVTGIMAATMAAWMSWRLVGRRIGATAAALATIGVWLGSHAFYYTLVSPSYSHAASMLTASVFVSVWIGTRDAPSMPRFLLWGGLCGLCALMRWQDAVFLAIPAIDALRWPGPWPRRITAGAAALAGFLAAFSPQMIVWTVLYGRPLALPQGPSFMQWTAPHPWQLLFSDNHGLFVWAPILVPAVLGLVTCLVRDRALRWPVGLLLLATWYTNAAVADWWGGEAFGARRFLSLFPWFVLGLGVWLQPRDGAERPAPWRIATVAVLTLANGLLLLQYELFMRGLEAIAPYPHGGFDMWVVRFAVPIRLLARWWS
jgi:hypothetical protein